MFEYFFSKPFSNDIVWELMGNALGVPRWYQEIKLNFEHFDFVCKQ